MKSAFYIRDRKIKDGLIAPIFAVMGVITFLAARGWSGPPPTNFFEMQRYETSVRTVDFIVLVMLIIVGLFIRRFRKRVDIERQSAEEVLSRDPRKPILYLRAFDSDREQYKGNMNAAFYLANPMTVLALAAREHTFEEKLLIDVDQIGPFVGLAEPSGPAEISGAARFPTLGDDWQTVVGKLLEMSELIILRTGMGTGLIWELEELRRRNLYQKVILYIEFYGEDSASVCKARFEKFANWLHGRLNFNLPTYRRGVRYLYTPISGEPLAGQAKRLSEALAALGYFVEPNGVRASIKATWLGASYLMRPFSRKLGGPASWAMLLAVSGALGASLGLFWFLLDSWSQSTTPVIQGIISGMPVIVFIAAGVTLGRFGGFLGLAGSLGYVAAGFACSIAFIVFYLIALVLHFGSAFVINPVLSPFMVLGTMSLMTPFLAWCFGLSKSEQSIVAVWRKTLDGSRTGQLPYAAPPP